MQAASFFMITFRVMHILAGVIWGGSVFLFVVFLQPSAAAIGPAAAPFVGELLGRRKLLDAILWIAAFSIVGGAFLYWHDVQIYGGLGDWVGSRQGFVLTIGAVAAIVAFLIGLFGTRPRLVRVMALNRRAAQAGGPPPPEDAAEIGRLQPQLRVLARTSLALIGVSVLAMSTARYW
jgi:uncharacterized membrane protein